MSYDYRGILVVRPKPKKTLSIEERLPFTRYDYFS